MTFMQSLASNPASSVYGQTNPSSDEDVLGIVNKLKDREFEDFTKKANFMSDLSLKQDRLRKIYDNPPTTLKGQIEGQPSQQGQQNQGQMNTVMAHDPNAISPFQKAQLEMEHQKLGMEGQKLAQSGRIGEERLEIQSAQEKLNEQKNAQIHEQKTADMQRKIEDSTKKFEMAQAELDRKTKAGEDTLQAHKDLAAAVEERHKLEMSMKEHQFKITSEQHDKQIKDMEERIKQSGRSRTTTKMKLDASGNPIEKESTTERGSSSDKVQVKGKDGKMYEIPSDKEDEWNARHAGE